jgi:tetratricopeptide (TPR) repeat protein
MDARYIGLIDSSFVDSLFSSTMNQQSDYDSLSNAALGRGIDRLQKNDYAGAIKEFKRSLALSPSSDYSSQTYDYMAQAYLKQNDIKNAINTYKQAITQDPSNDSAHLKLGTIYFNNSQFKESMNEYLQAVRINPASAQNRYALGESYMALGKNAEARAQFKTVTQISPRDATAYDALGQALRKLGSYDDAVTQFKKAISLDKKNADAYLDLGYTYADMNHLDDAAKQADMLDKLDKQKSLKLQDYIKQVSDPKITMVFSSTGFPLIAGSGTVVSTMDSQLMTPYASKDYSLTFMFDKDMNPSSVQNPYNWQISRATSQTPGGAYNWGLPTPSTEISLPSMPYKVIYDQTSRMAEITFRISQNELGNGTLDPSRIVFKFSGVDASGKAMDRTADEYSGVSKIV